MVTKTDIKTLEFDVDGKTIELQVKCELVSKTWKLTINCKDPGRVEFETIMSKMGVIR